MKLNVSAPEAKRFPLQTRTVVGRSEFNHWLVTAYDEAVKTAIYGSDDRTRSVAAGRAQVLSELVELFVTR